MGIVMGSSWFYIYSHLFNYLIKPKPRKVLDLKLIGEISPRAFSVCYLWSISGVGMGPWLLITGHQ